LECLYFYKKQIHENIISLRIGWGGDAQSAAFAGEQHLPMERKITKRLVGKAIGLTIVSLAQHVLSFATREWPLILGMEGMPHAFSNLFHCFRHQWKIELAHEPFCILA
jgi:hypothetical protein